MKSAKRDAQLNEQAWQGLLHHLIAADRGITCDEIASESGIPARTIDRYLAGTRTRGLAPGHAETVDDALTRISERQGLTPLDAIRVGGPLLEDGLPETIEYIDPGYQSYLREMSLMELMT